MCVRVSVSTVKNEMFKLALANASRHVLLRSCYESILHFLSMNNAMGKLIARQRYCLYILRPSNQRKSSVCIRSKHCGLPGLPDHAETSQKAEIGFSHT